MADLQLIYDNILAFFKSTYMYIFCFVGLMFVALSIYNARDSQEVKKKIITWVVVAILVSSLAGFSNKLFGIKETVSKYYFFKFDKAGQGTNN